MKKKAKRNTLTVNTQFNIRKKLTMHWAPFKLCFADQRLFPVAHHVDIEKIPRGETSNTLLLSQMKCVYRHIWCRSHIWYPFISSSF